MWRTLPGAEGQRALQEVRPQLVQVDSTLVNGESYLRYDGFHILGIPQARWMREISWKVPVKLMIRGYTHFRKHPYIEMICWFHHIGVSIVTGIPRWFRIENLIEMGNFGVPPWL